VEVRYGGWSWGQTLGFCGNEEREGGILGKGSVASAMPLTGSLPRVKRLEIVEKEAVEVDFY
jgi:hypothetical protein